MLICSSAGGGLRLAVVGFERDITARAGRMVALSAGAAVVHVSSGALQPADVAALAATSPDLLLLVGGTDGGNATTLLHNAETLAQAGLAVPVVLAGNIEARGGSHEVLVGAGTEVILADNLLPRIGALEPVSARSAIRAAFLRHVIGGKGLSAHPDFVATVRAPTPDAVLDGVEILSEVSDTDVMVIDIGGATTDVYSVIRPQGEDATLAKDVVGNLWAARTVEADLGMRFSAQTALAAAAAEGFNDHNDEDMATWATEVNCAPGRLATTALERSMELRIARMAAVLAARRHGRPSQPGLPPRPLADVGRLIGSGGVLRYADPDGASGVLESVINDVGGGWRPPSKAYTSVDTAYLLCAIGLLANDWPQSARALAQQVLAWPEGSRGS